MLSSHPPIISLLLHKCKPLSFTLSPFPFTPFSTPMALCNKVFIFSIYSFIFISTLTEATIVVQKPSFQFFNVSASIDNTRQLFLQKDQQNPYSVSASSSSTTTTTTTTLMSSSTTDVLANKVLSLSIHPRVSLTNSQHKSYLELTLSRLARDSSRVNSINRRIHLALSNFTHSEFKPVEIFSKPEDLEAPVTSGTSLGSGEYFARIGVGQPEKEYYMVIDTGSDVSWLQCEPCSDCYQQSDPVFNPAASSSYHAVGCLSPECTSLEISACGYSGCLYQVSYGDGSYTVGQLAKEALTFGKSGRVDNVAIGCGHDNEGLFIGSAGILALGGGSLSLLSQIKASAFSYCLVNRDSNSASTLEFNSAPPGDSVVASMLRNPKIDVYFYVDLVGISVGGENLQIPASVFQVDGSGYGGVIVDSGTAVTRLTTQAYNPLRDAFLKYTDKLPKASTFAIFDTCYDLSSMPQVTVPTIALHFNGGKALSLKAENYLLPVSDNGKFCLAFAPTTGAPSIIGNVQQQGTRVGFDLTNRLISFSPNKC